MAYRNRKEPFKNVEQNNKEIKRKTKPRAQKKKERRRLVFLIILIIIIAAGFLFVRAKQRAQRAQEEYKKVGKIHSVDISDHMEDYDANDTSDDDLKTRKTESLTLSVINVGNGQSVYIHKGKYDILVDGGPSNKGATVCNFIKKKVKGDLDYVISSNASPELCGGLSKVYENFHVKNTIYGVEGNSREYQLFKKAAKSQKESVYQNDKDMTIDLGDGAVLKINDLQDDASNPLDNSIVWTLNYGKTSVFSSSDCSAAAERKIGAELPENSNFTVYIAGHHGGGDANSAKFLERFSARYVIVSSGSPKNNGGKYPSEKALERLYKRNQGSIFGTYKTGTFTITTNGKDEPSTSVDNLMEHSDKSYDLIPKHTDN